jgi:hypothetical protein
MSFPITGFGLPRPIREYALRRLAGEGYFPLRPVPAALSTADLEVEPMAK